MAKTINTSLQAANATPGSWRVEGAVGLYLLVREGGARSWVWRYRFDGKRRAMGLGAFKEVSLAAARAAVDELKPLRRKGVDPINARRREREANIARERATAKQVAFADAAKAYLETHAPKWKHIYARSTWWGPIKKYALPAIGDMFLGDIEPAHVAAAMNAAIKAKAPVMARKVRAAIEQVIDAGIALGQRDAKSGNPAQLKLVEKIATLGKHKTRHYPRIKELEDAPAIFRKLKGLAATPPQAPASGGPTPSDDVAFAAWVFMIATAARPSEALKARWSEVDFEKKLWTLPDVRTKSDKEHSAPLSSTALWALELMKARQVSDAVFPGRGGAPLGGSTFAEAAKKAGLDAGAPHSWRSIFRDWAGDIDDAPRELAEAALAHTLDAVEGAYRRGTAIKKRRPMMQRYADWLENDASTRVVAFPARAS
jgi:integrase